MPESLLPPTDVATNVPALVYWVMAVLVVVTGFLYWQKEAARSGLEDELRAQKTDTEKVTTALNSNTNSMERMTEKVAELIALVRSKTP